MDDLNENLQRLIADALTCPVGSVKRQQKIQRIYQLVMKSKKLWKEYSPYYNDALQEMWEYCCQHLEEYDPTVCSVITWLDDRLKKRLRYHRDVRNRERNRQVFTIQTDEGTTFDPIENLAARSDIQPILEIWQETLNWVQSDPEERLRNTLFRKRQDINAQVLFLMRFPTETPWSIIAERFQLTPAETKYLPQFYNRRCLPLLREFGISRGYI